MADTLETVKPNGGWPEGAASSIVHWPGKDTPACNKHAAQLVALAGAMGFCLSVTPLPLGTLELECTNCANEAKKAK